MNEDSTTTRNPELQEAPPSHPRYVAWCDVMGASLMMQKSFRTARYRVFQFYALVMATSSVAPSVNVFPAGDGVFLVAEEFDEIQQFLIDLMGRVQVISKSKIDRNHAHLAFLVRAAVAYGEVSLGMDEAQRIAKQAGIHVTSNVINNVLVGPPMSVAYHLEKTAPPLGIILDISVLQRHTELFGPFARWSEKPSESMSLVQDYFGVQLCHAAEFGFDVKRIDGYLDLAREYFEVTLP